MERCWGGSGRGSAPSCPPCPTSFELRRVARHQKLAVATAMQNSRMVKMSKTMEMPFPASSRAGKNKPQNISSAQEEETPQDRTPLTFWGKDFGVHLLPQVLSTTALALGAPRSHPDPPTSLFLWLIERNGHFQGVSHLPRYQPKIGQAHGTAAADGPRSGCHQPWGP